ncbi:MAG: hypothetical protein C0423_09170 [Methylibium sp.]|nr:hypothetical protein [Methylibium sp.]
MSTSLSHSFAKVAVATGFVLLLPLVAMQFSSEVRWGAEDFLAAGALLFGACMLYMPGVRRVHLPWQRRLFGALMAVGVALVWAELAVGVFS